MSDRELLQKAAKAADIELVELDCDQDVLPDGTDWNPLTDDGDALRLAVKLRLIVDPVVTSDDGSDVSAAVWCSRKKKWLTEPFGDDPYAATRRCIVRAAAALAGEAKP